METSGRVLYVDSEGSGDAGVLKAIAAAGGAALHAVSLDEAQALWTREPIDLLVLRDRGGALEPGAVVRRLREGRAEPPSPVIVLTDREGTQEGAAGCGPVDVVSPAAGRDALEARIRYNLGVRRILHTAEERALKLASIIEISEAINQTLEADQILYNIARKLSGVMDLVRCSFILPDRARQTGQVLACKDDPNIHNLEIDLRNYPEILRVLETGRLVMIEDVAHDPMMADVLKVTQMLIDQSILTLPLTFQGTVLGILQIRKKGAPKGFSPREIDFCQLIANAAAIALKNAQLYEDIEKRNEILTAQKGELETLSSELKAKNEELLELQKLKEEFTAMIVHDLRSPMTIVQGALEILKGATPTEQQKGTLLRNALGETGRILEMINNLLEISKIERGEIELDLEPVQVDLLLRDTVDPFRILCEKRRIELAFAVPEDIPCILGDRSKLRQVFTNLINNAVEHTPDQGRIAVSAHAAKGGAKPGEVTVLVEDNGCGIPGHILPRIFDKFIRYESSEARKTRAHRGTGLGLAIVKLFTEAHRGRVSVTSSLGQGSTFAVVLPVDAKGR